MNTDSRSAVSPVPDSADDPDLGIARLLTERIAARSELLRELVLLAGLTRSFDSEVLRRLAGRSVSDREFDEAYGKLFDYPFVERRGEQSWAVHDSIRGPLLKLWELGADLPGDRLDLLRQLEQVYLDRYESLRRAIADLSRAGDVIRLGLPGRFESLAESIEDQLIRSAIDAVNAALRQSLGQGKYRFGTIFAEFESDFQFRLCDLVVRAWAADEPLVDDDDRALFRAWTLYYRSRLATGRQQWQQSLEYLNQVDSPEAIDLRYAMWHYVLRTNVLIGLSRITEAISSVEEQITLREEHPLDDDENASIPWFQKAHLYGLLWDTPAMIDALRHAARVATSPGVRAGADLNRAGALTFGPGWVAVDALLTAVAEIRELGPDDEARHQSRAAALTALEMLGSRSARLCATLAEQCRQLSEEQGDQGRIEWLLMLAHVQASGGRRADAVALFGEARTLAVERLPAYVWEIDASRAQEAEILGEPLAGGDANVELLDRPNAPLDPWNRARCLTNAGICYRAAGRYEPARVQLEAARDIWRQMGHERGMVLTAALLADVARRRGDLDTARALLAPGPQEGHGYEGVYFEAAARLALDVGDYPAAADHSLSAFRARALGTDLGEAVDRGQLAVTAAVRAGRYGIAAQLSTEVDAAVRAAERYASWQPDDRTRLADEHAARAVRILATGAGTVRQRARSAVDHLQHAIELDGGAPWFHAEIGFAERAAGRERQAAQAFAAAARGFDDPLLSAAFAALAEI